MTEATATPQDDAAAAQIAGAPLHDLPEDLYIPPSALRVFLEAFEGPLDLLLYLIRKQNIDILDIPVHKIAYQYFSYINLMQELEIELAGEYLLMAAMLTEIKSRMLLPKPVIEEEEGEDPRAELIRRLQEYEQFKQAAEQLDTLPCIGHELVHAHNDVAGLQLAIPLPDADIGQLLHAFRDVLARAELFSEHQVERDPLYVRAHMTQILLKLETGQPQAFITILDPAQGRLGVIVSFLAILELAREALITIAEQTVNGRPALILAKAA